MKGLEADLHADVSGRQAIGAVFRQRTGVVAFGQTLAVFIADQPVDFAERCLELLADRTARERIAQRAWELVQSRYSWEVICARFEELLQL